jgi:UDP-glucose 4-epimerase
MKIIVTGGAGFIGSHVVDAFIKAGHKVVVVDNLSTGTKKNLNPKAKFYKADIRDTIALKKIFLKEKPDVVDHHAAFISVTESVKQPRETFEINVMGTLNVLLAFAEAGGPKKRKFIFSSTGGAIYGNPKKLPVDESTPPQPLSPYALSKQIDEEIIAYYCDAAHVAHTILRYANVYGPRQRAGGGSGIFPIFMGKMKIGERPTIFGDGNKTRDYVYVEDIARANFAALNHGDGRIINIASNKRTSDDAVFKGLAKAFNFKQAPRYAPIRKGEIQHMAMSFALAHKVLGWKPTIDLEEGLKRTVASL